MDSESTWLGIITSILDTLHAFTSGTPAATYNPNATPPFSFSPLSSVSRRRLEDGENYQDQKPFKKRLRINTQNVVDVTQNTAPASSPIIGVDHDGKCVPAVKICKSSLPHNQSFVSAFTENSHTFAPNYFIGNVDRCVESSWKALINNIGRPLLQSLCQPSQRP
jgi:hypothetical protein